MPASPSRPTACLALADGTIFYGKGFGATGDTTAELCFNTAMTGYQEIMTDPSYAGQIVTFTFPHIGNTGVNPEDDETGTPVAEGMVVKWDPTEPSNWRSVEDLNNWMTARGRIAIGGVDTRRLTRAIRQQGAPHVALAHDPEGNFDIEALVAKAREFSGLEGLDLAKDVTCAQSYRWDEMRWAWPDGYPRQEAPKHKVVAVDFGAKRNILRCLASAGCDVTVLPASATAEEVLAHNPDGVFLSNGPGDPAATGEYAVPMIKKILDSTGLPVFGICLGLQLLGLAAGFFVLAWGAANATPDNPVSPAWLVVTYFLHTVGELCISPIGLSAITKLSPARRVGQMMGIWFVGAALGNLFAGLVAGQLENMPPADLFGTVAMIIGGVGIIALLASQQVKKMMGGRE